MYKIKDKVFNMIYKSFWEDHDIRFGIVTLSISTLYFITIVGLYFKFIYRSI